MSGNGMPFRQVDTHAAYWRMFSQYNIFIWRSALRCSSEDPLYMYVYMYTHTHTHTHTYMLRPPPPPPVVCWMVPPWSNHKLYKWARPHFNRKPSGFSRVKYTMLTTLDTEWNLICWSFFFFFVYRRGIFCLKHYLFSDSWWYAELG